MALKKDVVQLDIIIGNDSARKELTELQSEAAKVKTEMKSLKKGTEEYAAASAKLEKINVRMDEIRASMDLTKMSMKELKSQAALLQAQLNKAVPGTKEYIKYEAELKKVKIRMSELTAGTKVAAVAQTSLKSKLSGIADGFNKYSAIIVSLAASLTGLVLSFRKVVQTFNDYEEKVDNLSALTGLAGKELDWLSNEARTLATTTLDSGVKITKGAGEIADAFTSVGSKRPELLGVKEDLASVTTDAIILSQAAKTDLDPAVRALTTTLNQFQLSADQSGRAINTIAAGSKVGAGDVTYVADAMEKAGTTANLMGMSIEEMVGAIETVAPFFTEASQAGNSLDKVLLKLKANNIGYADGVFSLEVAITELEERYAKGETAVKLFGVEHAKMGELLVANKSEYLRYTEAVTGTNIAIEQAIINTNNNASALAQAKNRVEENSIVLGEKLAPALTFSTNAFNYLMKALIAIINNWDEFKKYLIAGTITLAAYTIALKGSTIATNAYAWAKGIATKAVKLFNTSVKSNPLGLLLATLTAVVAAIIIFKDKIAESNKQVREFNKALVTEKQELNNVFEALKKTNPGTEERKELIEKINEQYGDYLPYQLTEKSNLEEIEQAQLAANDALQRSLVLKYQAMAQEDIYTKSLEKRIDASNKIIENLKNQNLAATITKDWENLVQQAIEANFTLENAFTSFDPAKEFVAKWGDSLKNLFPENDIKVMLDGIVKAEQEKNAELLRVNSIFNSYLTEDTKSTYNQELMELRKQKMNKLIEEEEYEQKLIELRQKYGIDYSGEDDKTGGDYVEKDYEDYSTDEELKAIEDKAKAEADLAKYIKELKAELLNDEKEKKLAEIELWRETEEAKINESLASEEQRTEALTLMNQLYVNKLSEVENEYAEKRKEALKNVYEFISQQEDALASERERLIEIEIANITKQYQEKIDLLLEFDNTQAEIAELEKMRDAQIAAYRLEKEKELAEEILKVREEYGLVTDEEYYENEIIKLNDYYAKGLLSESEYQQARLLLEQNYQDKLRQQRIEELNEFATQIEQKKQMIEALSNVVTEAKEFELQNAQNNYERELELFGVTEKNKKNITEKFEREKKEIEKKYAQASLMMTISKAVANAALAITRALAELGPIAGPIMATAIGASTGIQIAAAVMEYDKVSQLRKGKYPVIGKDDNKLYFADYQQRLNTGIVTRPTLVAEEPEAVIDYKTLYNPRTDKYGMTVLDHFNSIRAIKFNRVPQFAEGKYPDTKNSNNQNSDNDLSGLLIQMIKTIEVLNNKVDNYSNRIDYWQKNLMVDYWSFQKAHNEVEKLKTDTTLKRS